MSLALLGQGRNFSVPAQWPWAGPCGPVAVVDAQGTELGEQSPGQPLCAPTLMGQTPAQGPPSHLCFTQLQKLHLCDRLLETLKQHSL